jgi:hypothetical protein
VDLRDFAVFAAACEAGYSGRKPNRNVAEPKDGIINVYDLAVLIDTRLANAK